MPPVRVDSRWLGPTIHPDTTTKAGSKTERKAFESYLAFRFTPFLGTRFVEAVEGDTLWHIAERVYGEGFADLYWVLADFNTILDPFEKLEAGVTIRYPPKESIDLEIVGRR